jgi:hypothetical protein
MSPHFDNPMEEGSSQDMECSPEQNPGDDSAESANHSLQETRGSACLRTDCAQGLSCTEDNILASVDESVEDAHLMHKAISTRDVTVDGSVRKPAVLAIGRMDGASETIIPESMSSLGVVCQGNATSSTRAEHHSTEASMSNSLKASTPSVRGILALRAQAAQDTVLGQTVSVAQVGGLAQHLHSSMSLRRVSSTCNQIYKEVEKRHNTSMEAHELARLSSVRSLGGETVGKNESASLATGGGNVAVIYGNLLSRTAGTAWQGGTRVVNLVVDWVIASRQITEEFPDLDESEVPNIFCVFLYNMVNNACVFT